MPAAPPVRHLAAATPRAPGGGGGRGPRPARRWTDRGPNAQHRYSAPGSSEGNLGREIGCTSNVAQLRAPVIGLRAGQPGVRGAPACTKQQES